MTSVSGQCGPSGTILMLFRVSGGMILDSTCRHRQCVLQSLPIGGIPDRQTNHLQISLFLPKLLEIPRENKHNSRLAQVDSYCMSQPKQWFQFECLKICNISQCKERNYLTFSHIISFDDINIEVIIQYTQYSEHMSVNQLIKC